MSNTLLRSIRERLLDESESLAGLLRKCLLLGAETGSNSLRQWASSELKGYAPHADLPEYRKLPTPMILVSYVGGSIRATNQPFNRLQLPVEAQKYVPKFLPLHQPVEELEQLANQKSLSFSGTGLAYAQSIWNKELDWMQQITSMHFDVSGSSISGILGQIRTQLVDIIADLTADTPLTELPRKEQVDAAVGQRIGTQYNTTITSAAGPTAIGTGAQASADGLSVDDALRLLDAVRTAAEQVGAKEHVPELLAAVDALREELQSSSPDTGEVIKKAGQLKAIATTIGNATLGAAVGGAVAALTTLAVGGIFG